MANSIKERIYQMLDSIHDQETLMQVMEDVTFYSKKEATVNLDQNQLKELELAIKEADNDQVIDWSDFKKELGEWKKK